MILYLGVIALLGEGEVIALLKILWCLLASPIGLQYTD